jgi:hypothetical protein
VSAAPKRKQASGTSSNLFLDIICDCETWLNPTIYEEVLPTNSNYTIHSKYRPDGYGESPILIKENIISEPGEVKTSIPEN